VTGSLRGQLLVATPDLEDPNFFRTVVLVLEHNADGALGVVLNRPTGTDVESVLPAWAPLVAGSGSDPGDAVVFVGGPVQPEGAIGLARRRTPGGAPVEHAGFAALYDDLGTVDLERDPGDVVPPLDAARVFAGHAGWGPGQLDGEVAAHGWFVVAREAADLWDTEPELLWRAVLKRQPGRVGMFAGFPADPALN
jgi:putative transcriptional regulator